MSESQLARRNEWLPMSVSEPVDVEETELMFRTESYCGWAENWRKSTAAAAGKRKRKGACILKSLIILHNLENL